MENLRENIPEGLTEKDIRFNWNYQRWGLYHNALIHILSLTKKDNSELAQKINHIIDENRKEMADYDRFLFVLLMTLLIWVLDFY